MRTIEEIQDYCMALPPSTPVALYDEEIEVVHDTYAREQDTRRMVDGCAGMIMGHPIYRKTEWLGDSLWPVEYVCGAKAGESAL